MASVDLARGESVQAFIDGSATRWGGLDAIVSVTGPLIPLCPLTEVSEEDFKRVYEVDVFGRTLCFTATRKPVRS